MIAGSLSSAAMALFFIDTSTGQVATRKRLIEAGHLASRTAIRRARGTGSGHSDDATTLWYAVMRRREKGIFIGTLTLRHGDHHALLLERGWEEIRWRSCGADAPQLHGVGVAPRPPVGCVPGRCRPGPSQAM